MTNLLEIINRHFPRPRYDKVTADQTPRTVGVCSEEIPVTALEQKPKEAEQRLGDIKKVVAEEATILGGCRITVSNLESPVQIQIIARSRQVAMYIARVHFAFKLQEIAREFGNRDHKTVSYTIKKVHDLRAYGDEFTVCLLRNVCKRIAIEVPPLPKEFRQKIHPS